MEGAVIPIMQAATFSGQMEGQTWPTRSASNPPPSPASSLSQTHAAFLHPTLFQLQEHILGLEISLQCLVKQHTHS